MVFISKGKTTCFDLHKPEHPIRGKLARSLSLQTSQTIHTKIKQLFPLRNRNNLNNTSDVIKKITTPPHSPTLPSQSTCSSKGFYIWTMYDKLGSAATPDRTHPQATAVYVRIDNTFCVHYFTTSSSSFDIILFQCMAIWREPVRS